MTKKELKTRIEAIRKELHALAEAQGIRPNPYEQGGASFDLFGGPSRALPKKVSDVHRPRVKIRAGVATLGEHSPFKGEVHRINPAPRVALVPVVVTLSAAESAALYKRSPKNLRPSPAMVRAVLETARAQGGTGWDHVEVKTATGKHAFDVLP